MNEELLQDLRVSVLLEALREIEEIADDELDAYHGGGDISAKRLERLANIARAAINKVDPT